MPETLTVAQVVRDLDTATSGMLATYALRLAVGKLAQWSAELRWTEEPNRPDGRPDRSVVFYATAGDSADNVALRVYDDWLAWRRETAPEPPF